jgi:adenylate cyclase
VRRVHHVGHTIRKTSAPAPRAEGRVRFSGRVLDEASVTMSTPSRKFTQVMQASLLRPEMQAELDKFRREITVMFTDIRGSTAYFEKYGDIAGVMMVHECTELIKRQLDKHNGTFIKTIGDAVMATFDDCKDAVESAVGIHQALRHRNALREVKDRIAIRIGLNHGSGIVRSADVFGDVVNVASRVESVAQPEQIVISAAVNKRVAPLNAFEIHYLGQFALKGKEGPTDLFEVVWDETAGAKPVASHTVVMGSASMKLPTFKLQHIVSGKSSREWELRGKQMTMGQLAGDITFPDDKRMAPQHARLTADMAQLCVEDLSDRGVFVRLVATHTLQDQDVVLLGAQLLRFQEEGEALAAAASTGTALLNLAAMLDAPPAEFVAMRPDGTETGKRYALTKEEVTFGRTGATYNFPADEFMSRTHCRVYHRGENFFIEDKSRNGTFLKVRGKVPAPAGSTLIIGSQLFRVVQE